MLSSIRRNNWSTRLLSNLIQWVLRRKEKWHAY